MEKFKINGQTSIIEKVVDAIESSVMGEAFKADWNIERIDYEYGSTLYFSLKEGRTPQIDVVFWIGYYAGE